ncbi:MAG: hypothetical protein ACTS5A_01305 [Candidatus Hodgkinia cicadicola]
MSFAIEMEVWNKTNFVFTFNVIPAVFKRKLTFEVWFALIEFVCSSRTGLTTFDK